MTRTLDATRDASAESVTACVQALRRGELVILPTETVYGLAALPSARPALDAVKSGRSEPYSLAVDGLDAADRLAALPPGPGRRAAQRWWPGPITLVLPRAGAGPVGVRVPGHPFTRRVLAELGEPVLMPSANRPGAPAPRVVEDIDPQVRAAAAILVDGGPTALGEASTVLVPGAAAWLVLREGVVSRAEVAAHAGARVLVCCSGNTCRSPMAAALLGAALSRLAAEDPRLLPPVVTSAGVHAGEGRGPSRHAVDAMARRDLDTSGHRSRSFETAFLEGADLVLTMTLGQAIEIEMRTGPDGPQVALFDPDGTEVGDPFGGDAGVYEACARQLEAMARRRAASLVPTPGSPSGS